jgi:hypothetical protein
MDYMKPIALRATAMTLVAIRFSGLRALGGAGHHRRRAFRLMASGG